jgi:hypothetical protein
MAKSWARILFGFWRKKWAVRQDVRTFLICLWIVYGFSTGCVDSFICLSPATATCDADCLGGQA